MFDRMSLARVTRHFHRIQILVSGALVRLRQSAFGMAYNTLTGEV